MKHPDDNPLLKEILTDDTVSDLRHTSLDRALSAMRQERQRRRILRTSTLLLLPVALAAAFVWLKSAPEPIHLVVSQTSYPSILASNVPKKQSIEPISDEELFALFPGRSLALIGTPGNQKLVVLDAPTRN